MIRCPLCRARYRGGEFCRRCRADLRKLTEVEQHAARHAHHAVHQLLEGNIFQAAQHADIAGKQQNTRFHTLLYSFITSQDNAPSEER